MGGENDGKAGGRWENVWGKRGIWRGLCGNLRKWYWVKGVVRHAKGVKARKTLSKKKNGGQSFWRGVCSEGGGGMKLRSTNRGSIGGGPLTRNGGINGDAANALKGRHNLANAESTLNYWAQRSVN